MSLYHAVIERLTESIGIIFIDHVADLLFMLRGKEHNKVAMQTYTDA